MFRNESLAGAKTWSFNVSSFNSELVWSKSGGEIRESISGFFRFQRFWHLGGCEVSFSEGVLI